MKLATIRDGSRDGHLVVVSRDGSLAHFAGGTASCLARVLDDWGFLSPQLEDLSATLSLGKARHAFGYEAARGLAVLPRPRGLTRWRAGVAEPGSPGADRLVGGRERAAVTPTAARVGWAVITGDIPAGADPGAALDGVRLMTLAVDWHAWPDGDTDVAEPIATGLGPIAATPDELGPDWQAGRLQRPLRLVAGPAAGVQHLPVTVDFGAALARCAAHRPVPAGHVVIGWADVAALRPAPGGARVGWRGADGTEPCGEIEVFAASDSPPPLEPPGPR
jgi:fumarylacetoacetate (FAA) hydrolase